MIWNEMDDSLKHAEWKMVDVKDSIVYNSIYIKHKNRQNLSMSLEVRIAIALGERKRTTRWGIWRRSKAFFLHLGISYTTEYKNPLSNILMIYYSVNGFRNPGTCCSEETYRSLNEAEILKSKNGGKNDQGITN